MNDRKAYPIRDRLHGQEARKKLLKGVDAVADAVKVTMGAKGRTVITSYGHATKDGVTVARDVEVFEDPGAAHGAKLVKEASVNTCDKAGDGTTSVVVLAQSMIREGLRLIESGKDPQDLRREIEAEKATVLSALTAQSVPVTDVEQIATISANDEALGKIVAKAVNLVGADGLVTVERTYGEMEVDVSDGMQIDRGLLPGPFLTDGQRRRAEYENVSVLLFSGKIHDLQGFAKAVEPLVKEGKPLLIIADEYDAPVIRALQLTQMQGSGRFIPIKSVSIYHDETFDDIAAYTGATVLTEADSFKGFTPDLLGSAKRVISTVDRTTIQCHESQAEAIEKRIETINDHAKKFVDSERRNVEKRASRLKGKIAIIKLPETTDSEGREIRDRVEDAIYASQGALESGVVPGGGFAYMLAGESLTGATDGSKVLVTALQTPLRQIVKNAGLNDAKILSEARSSQKLFNVVTEAFEDPKSSKVIDPLKVALTAVENALSVALVAITTEVLITEHEVEHYA